MSPSFWRNRFVWLAIVNPAVGTSKRADCALNLFDKRIGEAALFAPGALANRTVFTDLGEGFVLAGVHSCWVILSPYRLAAVIASFIHAWHLRRTLLSGDLSGELLPVFILAS
jgi:hypothetical protein